MSDTTEAQRPQTAAELEAEAGRRAVAHHARSRSEEGDAGKAAAETNAERQSSAAQSYQAGQQVEPPKSNAGDGEPNFKTVTVDITDKDKLSEIDKNGEFHKDPNRRVVDTSFKSSQSENTATQGSAPNAGQDSGDKVNRNPANNPDQALVATADNDANAGEEAKTVTVMDRDHGEQNAGPMIDVDTTKTGPSGAVIGQDNREAVIRADERETEKRAFEEKAAADREAARTAADSNPNVATAQTQKPAQTDEERQAEADTATAAKKARDKAVADAEAKAKAKAAKKDDKTSAVDDVLK